MTMRTELRYCPRPHRPGNSLAHAAEDPAPKGVSPEQRLFLWLQAPLPGSQANGPKLLRPGQTRLTGGKHGDPSICLLAMTAQQLMTGEAVADNAI
jgi:hypothetical protein